MYIYIHIYMYVYVYIYIYILYTFPNKNFSVFSKIGEVKRKTKMKIQKDGPTGLSKNNRKM